MKGRPKFRSGQVVFDEVARNYRPVFSWQRVSATFWYGLGRRPGDVEFCIEEKRLRKLTKRERGTN
jgi:hypothetical protein